MLFYLLAALRLVPSFHKTKCKKLLIITVERIKLLEKRRQARVRQLYRDVIELLLLKKEQKVDSLLVRIWKELCLFSVYTKIAEYCGFVQINLKDIAAQRECPSGLEEPLAGLCFATFCCADLPELQELREIFAMKYGKQIVSSGQDLKPSCHVNRQLLNCLYAKDPSEAQKQAVLVDVITKYNVMQSFRQYTQHQVLCNYASTEDPVELEEGLDHTVKLSEVQHQFEYGESQDVAVVQEPNRIPRVCKEDLVSMDIGNETTNRKRALEESEMCPSAFKRAHRRTQLWLDEGMEGQDIGGKDHEQQSAEKAHDYGKPLCSHPPQHPPPLPPPKRAPPLPPVFLRAISMPSLHNDKHVPAIASPLGRCTAMANDYHVDSYGCHVHPRLPKYEDLVANFTALKG